MNYYGAKELAESFRTVRKNTIQIAEDIPEDKYGFQATPETRTVAQLLTHIAISYKFQHQVHAKDRRSTLEGFRFSDADAAPRGENNRRATSSRSCKSSAATAKSGPDGPAD